LRFGDPKLRDLAYLWSYELIMTEQDFKNINYDVIFGDVIKLRHLKYVIKMTSQQFFNLSPPPLAKFWLRPWADDAMTLLKVTHNLQFIR